MVTFGNISVWVRGRCFCSYRGSESRTTSEIAIPTVNRLGLWSFDLVTKINIERCRFESKITSDHTQNIAYQVVSLEIPKSANTDL